MLTCVGILLAVSLLMMSSGILLSESAQVCWHRQDRQIALQSAEAALTDARIVMMRELADMSSGQKMIYGDLTGNRLQTGGAGQTGLLPLYRIRVYKARAHKNENTSLSEQAIDTTIIYRVTALGFGVRSSTQAVVEADFSKKDCAPYSACKNFTVRRMNWRLLHDLPSDW